MTMYKNLSPSTVGRKKNKSIDKLILKNSSEKINKANIFYGDSLELYKKWKTPNTIYSDFSNWKKCNNIRVKKRA